MADQHAGAPAPSDWVQRWAALIKPGGSVLDVACGSGRHVRWLHGLGYALTALDRDATALQPLAAIAETVVADIEACPWPLPGRRFDAVVITNYLWRPLTATLLASLAPGGVLIHETFTDGHQVHGRPSRPEFLLQRGELLRIAADLHVVAFEDVQLDAPPRCVQRIAALAEGSRLWRQRDIAAPDTTAKICAPPNRTESA